jgi:hypothetical protein
VKVDEEGMSPTTLQPSTTAAQPPVPKAPQDAAPVPETSAFVTRRATPTQPRILNKNFLPPSLWNSDIHVSVKVYVDANGRPRKVAIDKGVEGATGYTDAAKQAAYDSTYSPATKGGKPVSAWLTVDFNFGKPR